MHSDQAPYRELLERVRSVDETCLVNQVIRPWLAEHAAEREFLAKLAGRAGAPVPEASVEELWRLYALSRNHDVLVTRLWSAGAASLRAAVAAAHVDLMTGLGLTAIARQPFHPFFHEIVAVESAATSDARIEIIDEVWSGFTLGPMMFARAGVRVRAGADHLDPCIAEKSVLYWAYARGNRDTHDLSVGWGSNSQWRTSFRRDYQLDGQLFYNVDARPARDIAEDDRLTDLERIELVRHRCFVLTRRASDDRFPYDDRVIERDGVATLA